MARSEAPQDPRPYVRVALDLPTNPKIMGLDNPAEAIGAYVASLCLSSQSMGDGQFSMAAVRRLTGVGEASAMALATQGLWHLPGHTCDRCVQPKPGHAVVHDYLRHQRSAEDVRSLSDKRRESGRKGAQKRWQEARDDAQAPDPDPSGMASAKADAMALAMADAEQVPKQTDSNVMAEQSRAEESRELPTEVLLGAPPASPPAPPTTPKRATRIPDDFAVTDDMRRWFADNCPGVNGRHETEKFVDYWRGKSGKDGTKSDWPATWRNWMRRAAESAGSAPVAADRSQPPRSDRSTTPYRNQPRHPRTINYAQELGLSGGQQ